jgi:hypothetical protein
MLSEYDESILREFFSHLPGVRERPVRWTLPVHARLEPGMGRIEFTQGDRLSDLSIYDSFLVTHIRIVGAASKSMSSANWRNIVFGIFSIRENQDPAFVQSCPIRHLFTGGFFRLYTPVLLVGSRRLTIKIDFPHDCKLENPRTLTLGLQGYLFKHSISLK